MGVDSARVQRLRSFIIDELNADAADLEDIDARIIEEEIIDSLGVFALVDFIEDGFGVVIEPEDITIENFATLGTIDMLVDAKLSSSR